MTEDKHAKPRIWESDDCAIWRETLDSYRHVILAQGRERLGELDGWYGDELPRLLSERGEPYITLEELQKVAAWKMTRGVWRERNRLLIGGNPPDMVEETSRAAFAAVPDPRQPITLLCKLAGVGAATASAVMAAYAPDVYPFFDELVAEQMPVMGPVAFTPKYYFAYAEALRERAARLTESCHDRAWTAQDVAQALWAASGGKIALA